MPGAQHLLDKIVASGGNIIFTTTRGDKNFRGHRIYSADGARLAVRLLGINYEALILDVDSPRIVMNDAGVIKLKDNNDISK